MVADGEPPDQRRHHDAQHKRDDRRQHAGHDDGCCRTAAQIRHQGIPVGRACRSPSRHHAGPRQAFVNRSGEIVVSPRPGQPGPRSPPVVTHIPVTPFRAARISATDCIAPCSAASPHRSKHGYLSADRHSRGDQPRSAGTYLHWSIFTVSVANLVLIAVMVIIFGVALLLPFPKARTYPPADELPAGADPGTLAGGSPGPPGPTWVRTRTPACGRPGCGAGRCACCRRASCCPTASPPTWPPGYTCSAWPASPRSGWRSCPGSPSRSAGWTGGTPTRWAISSTAFTCGASSCSWPSWSSTCGGSSGWLPGAGRRAMTWITGVVAFVASVVECFTGLPVAAELRLAMDLRQRQGRLQPGRRRRHSGT